MTDLAEQARRIAGALTPAERAEYAAEAGRTRHRCPKPPAPCLPCICRDMLAEAPEATPAAYVDTRPETEGKLK